MPFVIPGINLVLTRKELSHFVRENGQLFHKTFWDWYKMFAKATRGTAAGKRGRPQAAITKKQVSVRLSRDVIAFFQKDGKGWQTRLNDVLEEYVANH